MMTPNATDPRHAAAVRIARAAGARALDHFRRRTELMVETKGVVDYVTRADRDVEQFIRHELAAAFPDDAFLGEETAAAYTGALDRCWVVDPIDGTHNFVRGVPYWNVSIAYVEGGTTSVGAICDPCADEVYHAQRGRGAWLAVAGADTRLHCTDAHELAGSYIALGHHDRFVLEHYFVVRRRLMEAHVAMRNFGSAALHLAHVASGRYDAAIEMELSVWDAAAGLLLVTEAGGWHAPFVPASPTGKLMCLASAPGIARALEQMVRAA